MFRIKRISVIKLIKPVMLSIWISMFVVFSIVIYKARDIEQNDSYEAFEQSGQKKIEEKRLPDLKVYNAKESDEKKRYVEWKRDEAVKFGLEQIASSINYLFVAAAAILGFLVKLMVDPIVDPQKNRDIAPLTLIFLKHTAIGCFLSIFYGFFGRLYFASIVDHKRFWIYGEVGFSVLCQMFSFGIAVLLLVLAVSSLISERLKSQSQILISQKEER